MASDVSHLEIAEENLEATRALYGGKVLARLRFTAFPAVITIRPNVFSAKKTSGIGQVTNIDVTLPMPEGYKVKEIETLGRKNLDVSEAHTVVSGGRGLKDPANWRLLEDLRDSLGLEAALGAFAAGLILSSSKNNHAIQQSVLPLVSLFATNFFVLVGAGMDLSVINPLDLSLIHI